MIGWIIIHSIDDIQSITIINNGSDNGTVCVQCNYITGADATGCIVSLSNSIIQYNTSGCQEVTSTGFYTINIYEINSDGTIVVRESLIGTLYIDLTVTTSITLLPSQSTTPTGTMLKLILFYYMYYI